MNPNSELKLKSKWMQATIVLVVVSLMTVMVEPAAFARNGGEAPKSEEDVAKKDVVTTPLPNRPVIVATMAAALPQQPQTRTLATPATGAAKAPAKPQSNGKSRKWIFILAAVGAGAATAAVLARGDGPPPETVMITVGSPTVGGPQ
jgi:hypothetical protein